MYSLKEMIFEMRCASLLFYLTLTGLSGLSCKAIEGNLNDSELRFKLETMGKLHFVRTIWQFELTGKEHSWKGENIWLISLPFPRSDVEVNGIELSAAYWTWTYKQCLISTRPRLSDTLPSMVVRTKLLGLLFQWQFFLILNTVETHCNQPHGIHGFI